MNDADRSLLRELRTILLPPAIAPLIAQARELASPQPGTAYAERYHAALQELPEAVLAHRDLVTLLKGV